MTNRSRTILLASSLLLVTACNQEELCDASCNQLSTCMELPLDLSIAEIPGPRVTRITSLDEAQKELVERIQNCYPSMEYARGQRSLSLRGVYVAANSELYILFEIDGMLDDWIAFRVSGTGKIIDTFPYSPLSGLYVPRSTGG